MVALRIILGGIFIYAGYVKLRDPWQLFAASIASYKLVPISMAEIIAKSFPWFEVAVGGALLIGWRLLPPASICLTLMLAFFNVMIWRAFIRGDEIDCGCFGPGEALTWKTLVRDGSMLAGALLITYWAISDGAGSRWRERSLDRELAYHEKLYSGFAQQHFAKAAVRELRAHMVRRILVTGAGKTSRVLSLGCGIGDTELLLAPHVAEVFGIDLSPAAIRQARADAARLGIRTPTSNRPPPPKAGTTP